MDNLLYLAGLCNKIYDEDDKFYLYSYTSKGFRSVIVKNDETKTFYIVFRGTVNFKNLIEDAELVLGFVPNFSEYADTVYHYAVELAMKNKYNLMATGHSLGGSMCQYLTNKFGIQSITFNPFGIIRSFNNISDINKAKCTNYCVWGDEVSSIDSSHQYGNCINLITNEYNSLNWLSKKIKLHSIETVIKLLEEKETQ
jgi:hypothetical protein